MSDDPQSFPVAPADPGLIHCWLDSDCSHADSCYYDETAPFPCGHKGHDSRTDFIYAGYLLRLFDMSVSTFCEWHRKQGIDDQFRLVSRLQWVPLAQHLFHRVMLHVGLKDIDDKAVLDLADAIDTIVGVHPTSRVTWYAFHQMKQRTKAIVTCYPKYAHDPPAPTTFDPDICFLPSIPTKWKDLPALPPLYRSYASSTVYTCPTWHDPLVVGETGCAITMATVFADPDYTLPDDKKDDWVAYIRSHSVPDTAGFGAVGLVPYVGVVLAVIARLKVKHQTLSRLDVKRKWVHSLARQVAVQLRISKGMDDRSFTVVNSLVYNFLHEGHEDHDNVVGAAALFGTGYDALAAEVAAADGLDPPSFAVAPTDPGLIHCWLDADCPQAYDETAPFACGHKGHDSTTDFIYAGYLLRLFDMSVSTMCEWQRKRIDDQVHLVSRRQWVPLAQHLFHRVMLHVGLKDIDDKAVLDLADAIDKIVGVDPTSRVTWLEFHKMKQRTKDILTKYPDEPDDPHDPPAPTTFDPDIRFLPSIPTKWKDSTALPDGTGCAITMATFFADPDHTLPDDDKDDWVAYIRSFPVSDTAGFGAVGLVPYVGFVLAVITRLKVKHRTLSHLDVTRVWVHGLARLVAVRLRISKGMDERSFMVVNSIVYNFLVDDAILSGVDPSAFAAEGFASDGVAADLDVLRLR